MSCTVNIHYSQYFVTRYYPGFTVFTYIQERLSLGCVDGMNGLIDFAKSPYKVKGADISKSCDPLGKFTYNSVFSNMFVNVNIPVSRIILC